MSSTPTATPSSLRPAARGDHGTGVPGAHRYDPRGALPERSLRPRRHPDRLRARSSSRRSSTRRGRCSRREIPEDELAARRRRLEHRRPDAGLRRRRRSTSSCASTASTTSRSTTSSRPSRASSDVLAQLQGGGPAARDRDRQAPQDGRARLRACSPLERYFDAVVTADDDRAAQARPGAGARGARAARRRARRRRRSSATRPSTWAPARPPASSRSPSRGASIHPDERCSRPAPTRSSTRRRSSLMSSKSRRPADARGRAARAASSTTCYRYHVLDDPEISDAEYDRLFDELVGARGGASRARRRPTRRRSASARRPRTSSAKVEHLDADGLAREGDDRRGAREVGRRRPQAPRLGRAGRLRDRAEDRRLCGLARLRGRRASSAARRAATGSAART